MNLELMAMHFLRFEKACAVALLERSPRFGIGEPDVLGITKARYLLEIEIKRSLSDFRANGKKHHIAMREGRAVGTRWRTPIAISKFPKQFWFLVPCELVKKVEREVPDYAGLMRGPGQNEVQQVRVVKPAPSNHESERLTAREMMGLGHCMANQILSQMGQIHALKNRFEEGHHLWNWYPEI